ncbi:uncharacterized protein KIAA1958-like [Pecten maximus]|uniref:uncharacterized protein KIAA1958-like n=1 Tax=Pecten maximus TaxID=6579 RepID=UPI0014585472|nr:uncharacterized protein KIAA1958-like [Pecten maximus]
MQENNRPNFELKNSLFSDISSADDENILQCSMDMERMDTRFRIPLKAQDLQQMVENGKSTKTENKTRWAIDLFHNWQKQREQLTKNRKYSDPILKMSNSLLNEALSFFIGEVRNEAGSEYRPNTIYELVVSIQHHFRTNGRFISFLDDQSFAGLKAVLDSKMKELSKKGMGLQRRQADVISQVQEEDMWRTNILGSDTPQKLLDTMVFMIGLNFALRAGQEHRNLRFGGHSQICIRVDNENRRYLEYTEDVSKTNRGGILHRKLDPKITRAYGNLKQPERCIVMLYTKYTQARPDNCKTDAFYLRARKYINGNVWYQDAAVGVHILQQTVKRLCEQAGFQGFFTNHCLRATAATRLYSAGIDEQLISEKTGHRSNAVRAYKRTSDQQQSDMSDILSGNNANSVQIPRKESENRGSTEINIESGGIKINVKY